MCRKESVVYLSYGLETCDLVENDYQISFGNGSYRRKVIFHFSSNYSLLGLQTVLNNSAYDLFYSIELMLNNFGGNFGIFGGTRLKTTK